jgi:hypothetical protein
MKLHRTDIPAAVSDLGTTVVEVLPIDTVGDALADFSLPDISLPDLDDATDTVVEIGRSGSRRAFALVRVVRRNPLRSLLLLAGVTALVAVVLTVARRSSDPEGSRLTIADAA